MFASVVVCQVTPCRQSNSVTNRCFARCGLWWSLFVPLSVCHLWMRGNLKICVCVRVENRRLASPDRWNQWVCSVAARTVWWNVARFEVLQANFARDWVGAVDSACWKWRHSWRRALSPCQGDVKEFRREAKFGREVGFR